MKKTTFVISAFLFAILLSCSNKKDAFDTSSWYFKVKIDDKWHKLNDDLGAYLRTEAEWNWNNSINPNVAFGAGNDNGGEYMLFNYDISIVKYGSDSLPIKPKMEYNFRYFEYKIDGKIVIETPQSGWDNGKGKFALTEFKVVDTTGKFAGYFKGNMSYVDDQGKTVTITEGQFNLPRNYLK